MLRPYLPNCTRLALILVAILPLPARVLGAQEATRLGSVEFEPCPAGATGRQLQRETFLCGHHEVFENRTSREGRKIRLKITVVPAVEPDRSLHQPPVFALAGGPGEPAHNVMLGAYYTLLPGMGNRDLVVVDIRGTGGSNPLNCKPLGPEDRVQSWIYYLLPFEEARSCADALSDRADLTQYTTSHAADDLDAVRAALGYERFALWGGSYGTVLGQQIIRRHGDKVDVAVLLGVGPVGLHAPMGFARSLEATKDRLIEDCEADDACRGTYPNFRADFDAVLSRASDRPVSATVVSPIDQTRERVELAYGDFVMGVRFILYNAQQSASLPAWMARAATGDYEPLMQEISNSVFGVRQVLHYGLFLSMRCAEDLPYVDVEAERADAAGTMMGTYRLERELENCTVWPRAQLASDRHSPVESDVPVLLLSGSEDPVTPPTYGDLVAATLPNSLHVIFENRGHGFFDDAAIACLHRIVEPFMTRSSAGGIDPSCASTLDRLPFRVAPSP